MSKSMGLAVGILGAVLAAGPVLAQAHPEAAAGMPAAAGMSEGAAVMLRHRISEAGAPVAVEGRRTMLRRVA